MPELKEVKTKSDYRSDKALQQGILQQEMPFAVVDGAPLTELPQDLYIPPHALKIFLNVKKILMLHML